MPADIHRRQVRLFLGVPVSMSSLEALAQGAEVMRRAAYEGGFQIRWVRPANYHITLKFLGTHRAEVIAAIRDRLAPRVAEVPRFVVKAAGVGAFPDARSARVLWAGVQDPAGGLARLAELVEAEMEEIGFRREGRAFHPHITLGRVKEPDDVSSVLRRASEQTFRETGVAAVVLFESLMKSTGSEYVERARFGLEGEKRQTGSLQRTAIETGEADTEEPLDGASSSVELPPDDDVLPDGPEQDDDDA
jgi:RNA 2',3'-cyclic 3'-phosphodiesterase